MHDSVHNMSQLGCMTARDQVFVYTLQTIIHYREFYYEVLIIPACDHDYYFLLYADWISIIV